MIALMVVMLDERLDLALKVAGQEVVFHYVQKRVRISGIIVAEGLVDVEALGPDIPTP